MARRLIAVSLAAAALLVPAAAAGPQHVTVTLDWTPNPDHVGLYYAATKGSSRRPASTSRSMRPPTRPRR